MKVLLHCFALSSGALVEAISKELEPLTLYHIGDVPVKLRVGDDYAVMLVNDGWEENPSPRYILAIAKSRTVVDTKDLEIFKSVLRKVPKGTTLAEYDSCTVPSSWGLQEKHFMAYKTALKEAGAKLSAEPRITCYCEGK